MPFTWDGVRACSNQGPAVLEREPDDGAKADLAGGLSDKDNDNSDDADEYGAAVSSEGLSE